MEAVDSRSHAVRLAVAQFSEEHRCAKIGQAIVDAYTAIPQTADDDEWAMANANALTDAEPW